MRPGSRLADEDMYTEQVLLDGSPQCLFQHGNLFKPKKVKSNHLSNNVGEPEILDLWLKSFSQTCRLWNAGSSLKGREVSESHYYMLWHGFSQLQI